MKKTIFLFFAAILCAMTANAAPEKLYLTPNSNWNVDGARFAAYFFGNGDTWVSMTKVAGETNLYEVTTPAGYTSVIFCRMNPGTTENSWSNKWNQTADLTIPTNGTNNYTITEGSWDQGTWSTYTPVSTEEPETPAEPETHTYTVAGIPASVFGVEWAPDHDANDMVEQEDGTYKWEKTNLEFSGASTVQFKVCQDHAWTVAYPSQNYSLSISAAGTYTITITFDGSNVNATATKVGGSEEPEVPAEPVETITLYYVNSGEWSSVNAYVWVAESNESYKPWSGEAATKTDKTVYNEANDKTYDVYSYTFPITYNRVIFNGDGKQTQDAEAVYDAAKPYLCNAVWYESLDAVKEALKKPIPDETVYFINTGKWSKVMIYTWNGSGATSWPGVEMTKTSEVIGKYEVYSYTAKQGGQANLLFQESADVNKTADQTWQAGKYYMYSTNKWYDTKEDAEGALAGPATIVLHGNFLGTSWADTEAFTLSADQKTATLTTLVKAGDHEFGVRLNNVWTANGKAFTKTDNEHVIEAGSSNLTLNAEITGDYVFTWTYETNTLTVTYPTEEVVVEEHYYLIGTFNTWTQKDANYELTLDGTVYKKEVTFAKDVEFKINVGDWSSSWGKDNLGGKTYAELDGTNDGNLKMKEEKTFTVIFDPANNGTISFEGLTEKAPVEKKYYLIGSFNEWTKADATNELLLDGEVYKKEVTLAKDAEFKVNDGADAWWGKDNLGGKTYAELDYTNDGNLKMKEEKTFTIIFDPANNGTISFEGLTEKVVEAPKCYLMGNGDWINGVEMTLNPDNNNEYMLLNHTITDAFKFKYGEEWSDQVENYDFPGIDWKEGNIVLPEGIYDFYFKIDTKKVYIAGVYLRDVTNTWGTICLPHASTNFSGATFYEVSSLDPTKGLWLDELAAGDQLVAGKPYVFEATGATVKVTYTDAAVAAPIAGEKGLIGTFTDIAAGGVLVNNYIIANNAVWVANANNTLPANRAYINAAQVPAKQQAEIPGRRRVCMGENAATGVDNIVAPEGQTIKAIVNGQLVIIRGGEMYNVQGQKL